MNIEVPPLRDREGDVPLLAQHFLTIYSKKNRKDIKGFTPVSMGALTKYQWPGNVRELENTLERAVILCMGQYISDEDLLPEIIENYKQDSIYQKSISSFGGKPLDDVESMAIIETLKQTKGNKSKAAQILNITRTTLNNKLKKYRIKYLKD